MKNNRIRYFSIILIFMFIILTLRLAFLQILNGDYYSQQAEAVFSRVYSQKSPRGEILTRDGQKLATNIQSFNIVYTDNRKVVPEKDIPIVLLKLMRLIKNNTQDYNKFMLDTVPFKVVNNKIEFSFTVYVPEEDETVENDPEKQMEAIKKREEKIKALLKAKEERFKKDYNLPLNLDANTTFYELLVKFKIANKTGESYSFIQDMSLEEARDLLALRIQIDKNKYYKYKPAVIARNVTRQTAFYIATKSEELPNITFIEEPLRYYPNGIMAAHVIGHLKRIGDSEADKYKNLGYDINSELIGALGLENTFENITQTRNQYNASLRGEPKEKYITVDKFGNQLKLIGEVEGIPGDTIVTTIDYNLQKVAEESFDKLLSDLQSGKADGTPRPYANRGAVVVVDVKTGEILALVSRPAFDPNLFAEFGTIKDEETRLKITNPEKFVSPKEEFYQNYTDIIAKPSFNYATKAAIPPGSTFKLFTSIAGLEEGVITLDTIIVDKGAYRELPNFTGNCWIYNEKHSTHGPVNVVKALQVSCNYFYYAVGHKLGWERFNKWLEKFGLVNTKDNENPTGIEIEEKVGSAASVQKNMENKVGASIKQIAAKLKIKEDDKLLLDIKEMFLKQNLNEERLAGLSENQKKYIYRQYQIFLNETQNLSELLNASIGQGANQLTPLQIAQLYMTVVNGGYRYKLHLVKEILNPDGSVKYKVEPEVLSKVDIKPENYRAVMEGLKKVAEEGSAASILRNYPIPNGGKTGTAQVISSNKPKLKKQAQADGVVANGWYVGVAPIDNPQIVVVALVFNSAHGSSCAKVVKDIYDEYFGLNKQNNVDQNNTTQ